MIPLNFFFLLLYELLVFKNSSVDLIKPMWFIEVVIFVMIWLIWERSFAPLFVNWSLSCLKLNKLLEFDVSTSPSISQPVYRGLFKEETNEQDSNWFRVCLNFFFVVSCEDSDNVEPVLNFIQLFYEDLVIIKGILLLIV